MGKIKRTCKQDVEEDLDERLFSRLLEMLELFEKYGNDFYFNPTLKSVILDPLLKPKKDGYSLPMGSAL